jgi:hypothetical protein
MIKGDWRLFLILYDIQLMKITSSAETQEIAILISLIWGT